MASFPRYYPATLGYRDPAAFFSFHVFWGAPFPVAGNATGYNRAMFKYYGNSIIPQAVGGRAALMITLGKFPAPNPSYSPP